MSNPPIKEIKQKLLDRIGLIKTGTESGYLNDVTVLNGYMVHYVRKFNESNEKLKFPCVALQPTRDRSKIGGGNQRSKSSRDWVLIGAVGVQNPDEVTDNLDSLLYDIKRAVSFDTYADDSPGLTITLGEAVFDLPERGDEYAFFEMSITIDYIEGLQ